MKWLALSQKVFDNMTSRAINKPSMFWATIGFFCALVSGGVMAATAAGTLPVPVVTIYPGDRITPELLRDGRFSDGFIARGGYVYSAERLDGMVARRTLVRNRAIPENSVRKPYAVRNGQIVTLRYETGALSIVAKAISLKSGIAGDYVQARNIDSGRTVAGLVQKDGSILVSIK